MRADVYKAIRGEESGVKAVQKGYIGYFKGCKAVLDLGCGRGEFLQLLKDEGIDAIGVDSEEEMVKICTEKGLTVYRADLFDFLKGNESAFDGIFCSHFLEHIDPLKAEGFISLCHKALLPGGVFMLVTPNSVNLFNITEAFWRDPSHVKLYSPILVRALLESACFEVEVCKDDPDTKIRRRGLRRFVDICRGLIIGPMYSSGRDLIAVARKRTARED